MAAFAATDLPPAARATIFQFLGGAGPAVSDLTTSNSSSSSSRSRRLDGESAPAAAAAPDTAPQISWPDLTPPDIFALMTPGSPGYVVKDAVLGGAAVSALWTSAQELTAADLLKPAGMLVEAQGGTWQQSAFRGDKRIWLTSLSPCPEPWSAFLAAMRKYMGVLQKLTPAVQFTHVSVQLACFPGNDTQYVEHCDVDASAPYPRRRWTLLYYLNPAWTSSAGGCLRVRVPRDAAVCADQTQDIEPIADRAVLFDSERIRHAVLPSHATRYAVATWFYARPAHPAPALSIPEHHGTIFVSIASYRDPELPATLESMFRNAAHPAALRVGICLQTIRSRDAACEPTLDGYVTALRVLRVAAQHAAGPTVARQAIIDHLLRDEQWFLQIDSHMRFAPGWDADLLRMHAECGTSGAVLGSYPPAYVPGEPLDWAQQLPTIMRCTGLGADGLPRFSARTVTEPMAKPTSSHFCAAGYMFCAASTIRRLPAHAYPHLFFGEELVLSWRLWAAGHAVYAPNKCVIAHLWTRAGRPNWRYVSSNSK